MDVKRSVRRLLEKILCGFSISPPCSIFSSLFKNLFHRSRPTLLDEGERGERGGRLGTSVSFSLSKSKPLKKASFLRLAKPASPHPNLFSGSRCKSPVIKAF